MIDYTIVADTLLFYIAYYKLFTFKKYTEERKSKQEIKEVVLMVKSAHVLEIEIVARESESRIQTRA